MTPEDHPGSLCFSSALSGQSSSDSVNLLVVWSVRQHSVGIQRLHPCLYELCAVMLEQEGPSPTPCSLPPLQDLTAVLDHQITATYLIEHFKALFPEEANKKTNARKIFKNYVDNIAFVKAESDVKYVCLKKKFRLSGAQTEPVTLTGARGAAVTHGGQADPPADAAGGDALPGSGYGSDGQIKVPHVFNTETIYPDDKGERSELVSVVEELDSRSGDMGNRESFKREKRESKQEKQRDIPVIAVIQASPLPVEGSVFVLPGPVQTGVIPPIASGAAGRDPAESPVENNAVMRHRDSRGSSLRSTQLESDDRDEDSQADTQSLCGSRKHFIEVMMNSSPQVRRSLVQRGSVHLSSRDDSDTASLVSSNLDDDRTSVTLDPLEHEWMMCASDGEWGSLCQLLDAEPSLVLRKDFITGFTCLHWAAKQGNPELMALIINFAKQHNVPLCVDVRSNAGYTPLHVAAMHNHMEVVKLLVGAYDVDVDVRDYSGRKACQYLTDNVGVDIRDIIGAYERSDSKDADRKDGGRWRFSQVLQSNLKPLKFLGDSVDGAAAPREKVLRRKSSLSRMKPKLQRLRMRTSQIFHSTTFHDADDQDSSAKGSFRSRPKTHFFG